MPYLIGIGHGLALESLTPLSPQPSTPGMIPTRRTTAISGKVTDEFLYVPLNWNALTVPVYQSLLAQLGLDIDDTADVTAYVQDRRYHWVLRNATATLPQIGSDGQRRLRFLKDFTVHLTNLRAQS